MNTIDQDLTSSLLSSVSSSWPRSVFVTEKFAMSKYKNSQKWNQVSQPVSDCLTARKTLRNLVTLQDRVLVQPAISRCLVGR